MQIIDKNNYDVVVVGGGASGLMAAIVAARAGASVAIIELTDSMGHKLLATGNGRCNFTNTQPSLQYYNRDFADPIVTRFDYAYIAKVFSEFGLLFDANENGWVYPRTRFAGSVRDVLLRAVTHNAIDIFLPAELTSICKKDVWCIKFDGEQNNILAKSLVLACGKPLELNEMPQIARKPAQPVLGSLGVTLRALNLADGVRARCGVKILSEQGTVFSESGEVLFRKKGLSGIVIFNASRYAKIGDTIILDLFEELSHAELAQIFTSRTSTCSGSIFDGLLHPKLARFIETACPPARPDKQAKTQTLAQALKHLSFTITAAPDAKHAQIMRGGYSIKAFDGDNLMSKQYPGIFACGECLDVDAPCGGYNLHWAWASGILAGKEAAKWAHQ